MMAGRISTRGSLRCPIVGIFCAAARRGARGWRWWGAERDGHGIRTCGRGDYASGRADAYATRLRAGASGSVCAKAYSLCSGVRRAPGPPALW